MASSQERKLIIEVADMFDDGRRSVNPNYFRNSILTEFEASGADLNLAIANANKLRGLDDKISFMPEEIIELNQSINSLKNANKLAQERMAPFDDMDIQRLISQTAKGAYNADEVYKGVVLNGKPTQLQNIFKGLKAHDDYLKRMGRTSDAVNEQNLKNQIKKRLFADAFSKATKGDLSEINFVDFAREIKRFEADYPGKLDMLFTDSTGRNTGKLVRDTIEQINMINPRLKPQAVTDLTNAFTASGEGLGREGSASGLAFVKGLRELSDESAKKIKFEANRTIADLPDKGIEETVRTLFRPYSGANIEILKDTVTPEAFASIQQASMQKLLSKSIDFNGKGKINDIFKHNNLRAAINSYGDETLDAMFGKEITQGLKNFSKEVDVLTKGEKGRGGSAGTLIAAGISAAIIFAPLAALPTLAGLAVIRWFFMRPTFLKMMTNTDPGSIAKMSQAMERALRQASVRYADQETDEAMSEYGAPLGEGLNAIKDLINKNRGVIDTSVNQGQNVLDDIQNKATQAVDIPLPNVQTTQTTQNPQFDPMSPERIEFAERLAGGRSIV